jgi:thiopeptide-type bacteriocin biosynthesis protein
MSGQMPAEALARVHSVVEPMLADRLVWKMQLDSYHREVEHWGGPEGVLLGEQFLAHDSAAVLAILEAYAEDSATLAQARWQLALVGVDGLWTAFGLDMTARQKLATACRNGLAREFHFDGWQDKQLSARYRAARGDIERVLGAEPPFAEGVAALRRRDEALAPIFAQLHALERDGILMRPAADLTDRISHLHVNRMLRSMLREQELLVMDFLARHHRSALARARPKR